MMASVARGKPFLCDEATGFDLSLDLKKGTPTSKRNQQVFLIYSSFMPFVQNWNNCKFLQLGLSAT